MMTEPVLLCSDLDRTILPNGAVEESPNARPALRKLAARNEVTLAYVTGRHLALIEEAIEAYDIPVPDYAIGDVGTTIYERSGGAWRSLAAWEEEIAADWGSARAADLASWFDGLPDLRMQEAEKQNRYKLSYYAPADLEYRVLLAEMDRRLQDRGVQASLIWSVDEAACMGLIDVLPARATKLHAVLFLVRMLGFPESRVVFAGDSGNDLPALTSGLQAVLVRNAHEAVRAEASATMADRGQADRLYVARGGFLGMNGNYTAGVLEGLAHFNPEVETWLRTR